MSRVRPALVAVLLVVAGATATLAVSGDVTAPAEPGEDPVVGTAENSSRVLLLTEADAAAFGEPDAKVSNTLQAGHEQLATTLQLQQVERRLDSAETDAEQREILENATEWAERRLNTLQERERTARSQYVDGSITAAEYVLELGAIHTQASKLVDRIGGTGSDGTLYDYAGALTDSDVRNRLSRIRTQLVALEGPVRERVAAAVHGERNDVRIHVTAGNGVMLSTIEDGQYIRETYREDNIEDETGEYGDISEIVGGYYPWVSNNTEGGSRFTLSGQFASQYSANHPQGSLRAWVSAATDRVYVERQQLALDRLPADVEVSATTNNTMLSTAQTYAGGPLLVRVQNETGAPIDSRVYLDGEAVGETGIDGRLWVLSPAGDYTITTTNSEGVQLTAIVTARPSP